MSEPDSVPEVNAKPLRVYAMQPRETFRWIADATSLASDGLEQALAAAGFTHDGFRLRDDVPAPDGSRLFEADAARHLMPEGWHYDDLMRCWRAPGEGVAFCGRR